MNLGGFPPIFNFYKHVNCVFAELWKYICMIHSANKYFSSTLCVTDPVLANSLTSRSLGSGWGGGRGMESTGCCIALSHHVRKTQILPSGKVDFARHWVPNPEDQDSLTGIKDAGICKLSWCSEAWNFRQVHSVSLKEAISVLTCCKVFGNDLKLNLYLN